MRGGPASTDSPMPGAPLLARGFAQSVLPHRGEGKRYGARAASHSFASVTSACDSPWPTGTLRCVTDAPAAASCVARRAALSGGTIGSAAPERISTGLPARSGFGGFGERHHGADQDRAGERVGAQQEQRGGDVGAVREAERDRRRKPIGGARLGDEAGELVRPAAQVRLVEHALGKPAEEARHAVLAAPFRAATRSAEPGATARPRAKRSFSSPPVPCSSSSGGASAVAGS